MRVKTEELLWTLLWTCDMVCNPTFRNLSDSFEAWVYRSGLRRQLIRLENRQLLEGRTAPSGHRLYRLTQAGRLSALGGRDPERQWNRSWDGHWRLVIFDVPECQRRLRDKLREYLHARGFGYLQNSVWVTPDPLNEERALLGEDPVDVESLIVLEARPCAGETDAEVVAGGWNFQEINRRYAAHGKLLARRPLSGPRNKLDAGSFCRWLRLERLSWLNAVQIDPLLPSRLLPADYAGIDAWRRRIKVMNEAACDLKVFADKLV